MSKRANLVAGVTTLAVVVGLIVFWMVTAWIDCTDTGISGLSCLLMVMGSLRRTPPTTDTEERAMSEIAELLEWDWAQTPTGTILHHVASFTEELDRDVVSVRGVTSCGVDTVLNVPGLFSRMGSPRCVRCCRALSVPTGTGSPKNDDALRAGCEARIRASLDTERDAP